MTDGDRGQNASGHDATTGHAQLLPPTAGETGQFGFEVALEDHDHRPVEDHDHRPAEDSGVHVSDVHPHDDGLEAVSHSEAEPPVVASLPAVVAVPGAEGGRPHDPGLEDRMRKLRTHLRRIADRVTSEEAAKLSLVAPFIAALGYDVFDPIEVVPGYNVDGGRADYAVCDDDSVRIMFGYVPSVAEVSANHLRRLANGVESAGSACAIVTDGRTAAVHGLENGGRMDERPLVTVRLLDGDDVPLALHAITKTGWNLHAFAVLGQTERERHVARAAILAELQDPTSAFLEAVEARLRDAGHHISDGTRLVIEAQAHALASGAADHPEPVTAMPSATHAETEEDRLLSPDEQTAFDIIKTICGAHINPGRVFARPNKSYTAVLLDDTNRRPIARIHFKADRAKYLGTFIGQNETRIKISSPEDIRGLNDKIVARLHELGRQ